MEEIYLPVTSHFQNGNVWTGSGGKLRYKITPGEDTLTAELWEGPWSCEDSTVEVSETFPLSDEGRAALSKWLLEWQQQMNGRPQKTLAETIAARDAVRARKKEAEQSEAGV